MPASVYMHPDVVGDIQDYLPGRDLVRSSRVNSTFYTRMRQRSFEDRLRQFSLPTPALNREQLSTIEGIRRIRPSTPIQTAWEIVDQAHNRLGQYRNQVFGATQIIPADMIHYLNSDACIPEANTYLEKLRNHHPQICQRYYRDWHVTPGLETFLQVASPVKLRRLRQLKRQWTRNPEIHPELWSQIIDMMMEIGMEYGYGPWASVFKKWISY